MRCCGENGKTREGLQTVFAQEGRFNGLRNALAERKRGHGAACPPGDRLAAPIGYEANAAALDETIDATLGIFSAWGDLRSHPARSHDSGTRNSE